MPDGNPTTVQESQATFEPLELTEAREVTDTIITNIEEVIVGKRPAIELLLTTILGRGHILIEDVPGVGKTMLARAVSQSIDGSFKRVQFTPDLLPTDVTGVNVFNQKTREFEFQPGPVFANFVLGDEINRAPPKTQSALLEAMEEEQVTVDGETRPVPQPFTVIATQNVIERDRTYELPVAQLDRFMKTLRIGYPDENAETEMLQRIVERHPINEIDPVVTVDSINRARETVSRVTIESPIREYVTDLANYSRENADVGISPRGAILLLRAAQARAVLNGRDYVIPDDIQTEAHAVLNHRVRRDPNERVGGEGGHQIVKNALENTPVP